MEIAIFSVIGIGLITGAIWVLGTSHADIQMDKCIADKINELPPIFESARTSIEIATDFDKGFFANQKVKTAFKKAISNGVTIKILTEGKPTAWFETECKLSKLSIKKVEKLPVHLMVVDSRHFRLETKHEKGQFGKLNSSRQRQGRAMLFHDFPIAGKRYSEEFNALWMKNT